MPALIVSYSRTGTADALAARLAARFPGAVVAPVRCPRYDAGRPLSYARAGFDALAGRLAEIDQPVPSAGHDPVILVCPVWAGRAAVPMVSWLRQEHPTAPGRIGVALVSGGGGAQGAVFDRLRDALPVREAARLSLSEREVRAGGGEDRIDAFVAALAG